MIEHVISFGISFLLALPVSILWVYIIDKADQKNKIDQNEKSI